MKTSIKRLACLLFCMALFLPGAAAFGTDGQLMAAAHENGPPYAAGAADAKIAADAADAEIAETAEITENAGIAEIAETTVAGLTEYERMLLADPYADASEAAPEAGDAEPDGAVPDEAPQGSSIGAAAATDLSFTVVTNTNSNFPSTESASLGTGTGRRNEARLAWTPQEGAEAADYAVFYATDGGALELYPSDYAITESGSAMQAVVQMKSGTVYDFAVRNAKDPAGEYSNVVRLGPFGGRSPELVADFINGKAEIKIGYQTFKFPADAAGVTMDHREETVIARRMYYRLTNYDRSFYGLDFGTGATFLRYRENEAHFMKDWIAQVYAHFIAGMDTATPSGRASQELVLSREGTNWFMHKGSVNLPEYGFDRLMLEDGPKAILEAPTPNGLSAKAMLQAMDDKRDELVAERKQIFARVKRDVNDKILAMDPTDPAQCADALAAYNALTSYEKTFVDNYDILKNAVGGDANAFPANIKYSGLRSPSGASPWTSATTGPGQWLAASNKIKEQLNGARPQHVWIVGMLGGGREGMLDGGVTLYFRFSDIAGEDGRYRGKTEQEWLADNIYFNNSTIHDTMLNAFDTNNIDVYLQVEAGYADMEVLIDMVLDRFGSHPCVKGFAVDVEWYWGTSEDSGITVRDSRAKAWNLRVKSHDPNYRLVLKDYEATRLPWTYQGETSETVPGCSFSNPKDDMIYCVDAQSFGSLNGTTVGSFEAQGAWDQKHHARDGEPVGMQTFYHDWAAHFYPNDVLFQIGYQPDDQWNLPLQEPQMREMSVKLAENCAMDQRIGIAWVNFNTNAPHTFWDIYDPTASNLQSAVNSVLTYLRPSTGRNGLSLLYYRFRHPTPDTWGTGTNYIDVSGVGAPTYVDALYVGAVRDAVVKFLAINPSLSLNADGMANLAALEPEAIDIRINELHRVRSKNMGLIEKLRADYERMTEDQKARVTQLAKLAELERPMGWSGVGLSAAGGTSWPQMGGVANANPSQSPNADQVVTLTWTSADDQPDESYRIWFAEAEPNTVPAVARLVGIAPAKNASGTQWSAAITIKSATPYYFRVESSARGMSNELWQAARNGLISPDVLVDEYISKLPSDPTQTKIEDRYNLVLIRRIYQKLTRFDRAFIADELRHFELCEAYWMADWVKGVYDQFKLDPSARPVADSDEYAKWRATAELILSREGAQWFMRWGSANVHEYGHNVMARNDAELREILRATGTTARLDAMDALRDRFVEERKEIFEKVHSGDGSVDRIIEAMDPARPEEVRAARAAYDALTPYERTFALNLPRLLAAEGKGIVPPNIKMSGTRQSTYGVPSASWNNSGAVWGQICQRMKEYFPGSENEMIWIVGALTDGSNAMKFGGGTDLEFSFASLLDRAPAELVDRSSPNAADHTYKGKTQAQWLAEGITFGSNQNRHDPVLQFFSENDIYVYVSVEAGFAPMEELIDMVLYRFGEYKAVRGFSFDCEWHMGCTEDSGIGVTDEMARAWNLRVKAHNPAYRMSLKDYEATRLPWNYRGEPGEEDMIFVIDAQSFGDSIGSVVGRYEANGAWYGDDYWYGNWTGKRFARDGMPVGNQTFYHDWSVYYYPSDVVYQFGYTGDDPWIGGLDVPFTGTATTPYVQYMSSLIAWHAPMDQRVGIAWVDFNLNRFDSFNDIYNSSASALGGSVNTALGVLNQGNSHFLGHRFTNPQRDELYGGGPILSDAMYVARMREMLDEYDAKGWTGVSTANRSRLELLEPMAIDVRIENLPKASMIKSGHRGLIEKIRAGYEALTDAQKAQVTKLAELEEAEAALLASYKTVGVRVGGSVHYGDKLEYVFSAEKMETANLIELTFEADGGILGIADGIFEGLNGFSVFQGPNWEQAGDGKWQAKAIIGIVENGQTRSGDMDIAKLAFDAVRLGDAKVSLVSAVVYGIDVVDGSAESNKRPCTLYPATATAKVFSVYDINGDDEVDLADLSLAFYYYRSTAGDEGWEQAKTADVNGDGVVDMLDLVEIYANFIVY